MFSVPPSPVENLGKVCENSRARFSPGYEGTENMFYFLIKFNWPTLFFFSVCDQNHRYYFVWPYQHVLDSVSHRFINTSLVPPFLLRATCLFMQIRES